MSSFETVNFKTSPSWTVRLNKPGKPMKVLTLRKRKGRWRKNKTRTPQYYEGSSNRSTATVARKIMSIETKNSLRQKVCQNQYPNQKLLNRYHIERTRIWNMYLYFRFNDLKGLKLEDISNIHFLVMSHTQIGFGSPVWYKETAKLSIIWLW